MIVTEFIIKGKKVSPKDITLAKETLNSAYDKLVGTREERGIIGELILKINRDKAFLRRAIERFQNVRPVYYREELLNFLEDMKNRIDKYRDLRDNFLALAAYYDTTRKVNLIF